MRLNWNVLVYYQKQFNMRYRVLTTVLSCTWIQCSVNSYDTFSQITINVCVHACMCIWYSFTPQALIPQGKILMYPLNRHLHVYK
jgi:collagenase-like PrtC family protease